MRRLLLLSTTLLILLGSTARAGPGVNMRWTACFGDGGAFNRNFACQSNAGSNTLVGSFVLGSPISQVGNNEISIDLAAASPTLPDWWAFRNAGTCRQASLLFNTTISPTAVACADWSNGQMTGAIFSYTIGFNGPATARIFAVTQVPQQNLASLVANQEYFSFNVVINNQKTVGTGTCAGCSVPVCLKLASIKVVTMTPANDVLLSGPTNGTDSYFVTWQNGAAACLAATPTRQETWGAVKSLYR